MTKESSRDWNEKVVLQLRPELATGIEGFDELSRGRKDDSATNAASTMIVSMRLYIAGNAPNSVLAIANLEAICRERPRGIHQLEIVDILEHPLRAMADGVLVTPSLTKVSLLPTTNVVCNLSETNKVLLSLGLEAKVA